VGTKVPLDYDDKCIRLFVYNDYNLKVTITRPVVG